MIHELTVSYPPMTPMMPPTEPLPQHAMVGVFLMDIMHREAVTNGPNHGWRWNEPYVHQHHTSTPD